MSKKVVKLFLFILFISVLYLNYSPFTFANNSEDSSFYFNYNGDGSDVTTKARRKTDNTYTYVKLYSGNEFGFAAEAKRGISNGESGDPFSYDYSTPWHTLDPGKCWYFKNDAHKLGFSATYLAISSNDHKRHTYSGVWSPDNMSGFGG
jgi:hypothetical protein